MGDRYIIRIGERHKIKLKFLSHITIVYAGMSSSDIFSLAIMDGYGHQGFGYNVFFKKKSGHIKIKDMMFHIIKVTHDSIELEKLDRTASVYKE